MKQYKVFTDEKNGEINMKNNIAIILDTNFFGDPSKYDFISIKKKLKPFLGLNNIEIFIPEISKREIIKHIIEKIDEDQKSQKSYYFKEQLRKNNFFQKIKEDSKKDVENFFEECNIKEISCNKDTIDIETVNNWFFKKEYPFSERKEE